MLAAIHCLLASSQRPSSLNGNSIASGTMNTTSVAAGGSLRTVPAIQALTARNGMRATTQATTGSRWLHSHASIRKTIASKDQQRAG